MTKAIGDFQKVMTTEFRNAMTDMTAKITHLVTKTEENSNRLEKLESENASLRKRMCDGEKSRSEKGLLLFQVAESESEDPRHLVNAKLQLAGATIDDHTDVFRMGKKTENKKRPIVVRFLSRMQCEQVIKKLIDFNKAADRSKTERINFKRDSPLAYVDIEKKHMAQIREARSDKKKVNWRNHCLYIDGIPIESACDEYTQQRSSSAKSTGRKRGSSRPTRDASKRGKPTSSSR